MSAYASVISLKNTIHHILHSSRLNLDPPSLEIIQVAYDELQPWKQILKRLDETSKSKSRKKVNALDGRIKDAIRKFEDSLESLISHQIVLQSNERDVLLFSIDLQILQDEADSFIQTLKVMEKEYIDEVDNMPEDEDEDDSYIFSSTSAAGTFGGTKSKMIGFSYASEPILCYLLDDDDEEDDDDDVDVDVDDDVDDDDDDDDDDDVDVDVDDDDDDDDDDDVNVDIDIDIDDVDIDDDVDVDVDVDDDDDQRIIGGYILVGMAGVGKTRLAREIYEDPQITTHFDCRLWITVGRISSARLINQLEVSQSILAELKRDDRCLIVVDDVWELTEELSSLLTSIKRLKNRIIRILLTTRDRNVPNNIGMVGDCLFNEVNFLNEEESKELLCHEVFGENIICPYQLDKAATKIANKCEGLPLTIVTVADILSKAQNRDPQYWDDVAEERNSVFTDAYDEMSKVLFPTYEYLPQHYKMLFLSMAVFPRDYNIPLSKIINMLKAEAWFLDPNNQDCFLEPNNQDNFLDPNNQDCFLEPNNQDSADYDDIKKCLEHLCSSHYLVLLRPKSTWWYTDSAPDTIKTCRLHSAWRQLCRGEARKDKFYHVLDRIGDASDLEEAIKSQRCLCLENNLLFGIKEFCNSVRCSNCASTTRSLLFFGPYQQYPTPIDAIGFKLLRELNALQLRFYTFPTQVLTLVQLKYLALTCNGDLPSTISKLFNLKVLIVHPHMSITKCCDTAPSSSYIPMEIWDMKELENIEILGKSFIAPPNDHDAANSLEKVSTVVGVNAASICTITQRIPNVMKLGVQMELTPNDDVEHSSDLILSCFPHISTLEHLETLKCSIINPVQVRSPSSSWAPRSLMLPRGLRKLHLSGMGFPWEYMDAIGSLPSLQVLKLRSYAFRGSKWETQEDRFNSLKLLVIEDSDLVEWKPASGSFRNLLYLSFKHCYKLQELDWPSEAIYAGSIELVDCNPLAVSCAKKLREEINLDVYASDDYEA